MRTTVNYLRSAVAAVSPPIASGVGAITGAPVWLSAAILVLWIVGYWGPISLARWRVAGGPHPEWLLGIGTPIDNQPSRRDVPDVSVLEVVEGEPTGELEPVPQTKTA